MSVETNTYIGTYVLLEFNKIHVKELYRYCPNHSGFKEEVDEENDEVLFCKECGTKLIIKDLEKLGIPYWNDVLDDKESEFFNPFSDYTCSQIKNNQTVLIKQKLNPISNHSLTDITSDMITQSIESFKKLYAEDIKILKENSKSFQIKFGCINYLN